MACSALLILILGTCRGPTPTKQQSNNVRPLGRRVSEVPSRPWFGSSFLDVLLEFLRRFTGRVDVQCDSIRVENCEASISPWVVFQWHDRREAGRREAVVLSVSIIHGEVVHQARGIACGRPRFPRCHELKLGCLLPDLHVHVPPAVKRHLGPEMLHVEIA